MDTALTSDMCCGKEGCSGCTALLARMNELIVKRDKLLAERDKLHAKRDDLLLLEEREKEI
jgi:hypothetical protein